MNWHIFTIVKATIWKFATGNRNTSTRVVKKLLD